MWKRVWRFVPLVQRRPPGETLVKVAGTHSEAEAQTWAEALRRQGLRAIVGSYTPPRKAKPGEPGRSPEWDVWVPLADEPQARLILGLSGHSVIRLPRQKPARKE